MGAETYKTYQTFKTRALNMAVNEINQYSDKNLRYEVVKNGRSVSAIRLYITTKDPLQRLRIAEATEREFGWDQMSLWDNLG